MALHGATFESFYLTNLLSNEPLTHLPLNYLHGSRGLLVLLLWFASSFSASAISAAHASDKGTTIKIIYEFSKII